MGKKEKKYIYKENPECFFFFLNNNWWDLAFRQTVDLHRDLGLLRSAGAPEDKGEESEEEDEGEDEDGEVAAPGDSLGIFFVF